MSREERRAAIRDALIDAAVEVFAAKGYEAASVAEIAETAGYTIGAIYSNFAGKRDLFVAVCQRQTQRQFEVAALATSRPAGDLESLAAALLSMDQDGRRTWLLWLEFIIDAQRDPEGAVSLGDLEAEARRSIARVLNAQIPGLGEDPTLAIALQALWRGWLLSQVADGEANATRFAQAIRWLVSGASADPAIPGSR